MHFLNARHRVLLLAGVALCCAAVSAAPEPAAASLPDKAKAVAVKVEAAIEHGAKAAASGVERGAKAAAHGVQVGAEAAARGVAAGAKATAKAADAVAEKVAPGSR
jgi:type IV secretory pathway TrbL component